MILRVCFLLCWITHTSILLVGATDIRLVDGSRPENGRVEVQHNGNWGTVCKDWWGVSEARVACRQLGYTDLSAAYPAFNNEYPPGTGDIILDNIYCYGSEQSLFDCSRAPLYDHDCTHDDDVGVTCASNTGNGCLEDPPCDNTCGGTKVVTLEGAPCPICICTNCPASPACPTQCLSGETEFYEDEYCTKCRCVAYNRQQNTSDDDLDGLSTGTVVAIAVATLTVPFIALAIIIKLRVKSKSRKRRKLRKTKVGAPKVPEYNNFFTTQPVADLGLFAAVDPTIVLEPLPPEEEFPIPDVTETGMSELPPLGTPGFPVSDCGMPGMPDMDEN